MSIPTPFNPMGTLGRQKWRELDLSQAAASVWATTELTPLGVPYSGIVERGCIRLASENLVWFGYILRGTYPGIIYNYGGNVPPRASGPTATPCLEFWALGTSRRLRVTFKLSRRPISAFWTDDDWTTWEAAEIVADGSNYVVETPRPACSLAISVSTGWTDVSGQVLKIEVQ